MDSRRTFKQANTIYKQGEESKSPFVQEVVEVGEQEGREGVILSMG